MRSTLERAAPALAALALIAAFFLVFVRPGLTPGPGPSLATSYDLHSAFLPKFWLGSTELAQGRLPTWNPHEYGGLPLLATAQPAALYPPKVVIFALLGPEAGYWAFLALHFVGLALGFLWFCREQGLDGAPALAGTLLWTFAIPVMTSNYHPTRIANLAWMPVVLVLVDRLARGGGRGPFAMLALVIALQLTAGYPEFTLDLALLVAVHATARWAVGEWRAPPHRALPLIGAAFLLGAVVAAAQLVPLAELGSVARREVVASTDRAATETPSLGLRLVAVVGLFPGLAGLAAVGTASRSARVAVAGALACTLMASTGWLLLGKLPGFGMIRFPWVWLFIGSFYLAWLAALGTRLVGDAHRGEARFGRAAALIVAAAALAWAALCAAQWLRLRSGSSVSIALLSPLVRNVSTTWAAALGVTGGALLAAASLTSLRRSTAPWMLGAAAATVALGHLAGYPYGQHGAPVARPPRSALLERAPRASPLGPGRTLSLHDIAYGYNVTAGASSVLGAEVSFLPWRHRRIAEEVSLTPFAQHMDWARLAKMRGFLDAADLRYLVIHPSIQTALRGARLERVAESADEVLFENLDRMGPAWVSQGVKVVAGEEAAREYVLGRRFDPHWEVVLESPPRHAYPTRSTDPARRPAWVLRPSPTELAVGVRLEAPGLLVVADTAHPGWQAWVGDRPAEWVTANYVHRAVELDPGDHVVRFEYRPRSVVWGLGLSALGTAVLAGLFSGRHLGRAASWVRRRAHRDRGAPPA